MNLDKIWNFFTYIFRIFKRDKRPEYIKVKDELGIEDFNYDKLEDLNI